MQGSVCRLRKMPRENDQSDIVIEYEGLFHSANSHLDEIALGEVVEITKDKKTVNN